MFETNSQNGVTVKAYRGDAMTLLAFDLDANLADDKFVGFSIQYKTPAGASHFLTNRINFAGTDQLTDSDQAPFQKFRWIHVPGTMHQSVNAAEYGQYHYSVTPRYWNTQSQALEPIQANLTVDVDIDVDRFQHKSVEFGFTRSFLTSQAYVRRFGENNHLIPEGEWLFDTGQLFCTFQGHDYSYEDLYTWLGFTARAKVIALLEAVLGDPNLSLDMFAYDFDEPVVAKLCLELAAQGRIRIILDNSTTTKNGAIGGHGAADSSETDFEGKFTGVKANGAEIVRGKFSRFAHDKIMIVKQNGVPVRVLTGSTNFSVTGFCVNANHVAIFNEPTVAALYEQVFNASWGLQKMRDFHNTPYGTQTFDFTQIGLPVTSITFSPHPKPFATDLLKGIADRITGVGSVMPKPNRSVLFSIMSLDEASGGAVYPALRGIQNDQEVYSYGVTDSTKAISLYKPGSKKGILVDAKSLVQELPPPFNQEVSFNAHNIHHKFVVLDFNTADARVYFGSSNLALGGEQENGDNLICIRDTDIATVFAVEAIRLVDHYQFRAKKQTTQSASKPLALDKTGRWARPYFDDNDFKSADRKLFA